MWPAELEQPVSELLRDMVTEEVGAADDFATRRGLKGIMRAVCGYVLIERYSDASSNAESGQHSEPRLPASLRLMRAMIFSLKAGKSWFI